MTMTLLRPVRVLFSAIFVCGGLSVFGLDDYNMGKVRRATGFANR